MRSLKQAWAIMFTQRAAFEKNLKPRGAVIGRAKKGLQSRSQMSHFYQLKVGEEQKRSTRPHIPFFSLTFSAEL